jgi:TonB family protein
MMARFGWSAVLAASTLVRATRNAEAQPTHPNDGDRVRRVERVIPIADPIALSNWTLHVYARADGWVELDLQSVPQVKLAMPWLVLDGYFPQVGDPVRSRGYFTPEEIRSATSLADSLIDGTISPSDAATRFRSAAPKLLDMPAPTGVTSRSTFDWYMQPRISAAREVEFGLGTCYSVSEAPPQLLGRGVTRSVAEFRSILRTLDSVAARAAELSPKPQEMRADVIEAGEAACEARPNMDVALPVYPVSGNRRTADVSLEATIDSAGKVTTPHVVAGDAPFADAALAAVAKWRFTPALLTKQTPVGQRVRILVHFAPSPTGQRELAATLTSSAARGATIVVVAKPGA